MEFFLVIFYHAIPGFIYDFVLQFTKNPRRLLPLYRKTHLFMVIMPSMGTIFNPFLVHNNFAT